MALEQYDSICGLDMPKSQIQVVPIGLHFSEHLFQAYSFGWQGTTLWWTFDDLGPIIVALGYMRYMTAIIFLLVVWS